jgi:ParB family chromosome partitioning protein
MPQQMMLPTASLRPDPAQPRKNRDPEKQRQLNESVALHGVLQPITVRDDLVTVVSGAGRLEAALAASLKEIPALILDKQMAEWQYQNLQLVENVVRSDLSQFDLWQACVRLLKANPDWGMKDLARMLSYDISSMTRIMSPSRCIPQAVDALRERKIVFGHTYAISKAETPEEQLSILNFCLSGASRDAAEKAVRKKRNGRGATQTPEVKVAKGKFPMPKAIVQISGDGLTISTVIDVLTDLLKEAKAGHAQGMDIRALMALLIARTKDKAKKQ